MLKVAFVRRRGDRDRVYVARQDGTSTGWDFPSYGDRLPHDLCHLVVEEGLGLTDGFWGLIDRGIDVALVNNHATLVGHGEPLVDQPGTDLSGLRQAEVAVAMLAGPGATVGADGEVAVARPASRAGESLPATAITTDAFGPELLASGRQARSRPSATDWSSSRSNGATSTTAPRFRSTSPGSRVRQPRTVPSP